MNAWAPILIIITVFFTLGFIFLMIGLARKNKRQVWEQTTGEIVTDTSIPGILIAYPSVEFTANDGKTYRVKSNFRQTPGLATGRIVTVFYDPMDPRRAQIDTIAQNGTIFTIIGSMMIGFVTLIGLISLFVRFTFFN